MNSNDISLIVFDVDGTLYDKDVEYNASAGSIQTSHDFFRYSAHKLLKDGCDPVEASELLINDYRQAMADGTIKERVASIPEEIRQEFDGLIEKCGSNGRVFDYHHGLKEKGLNNYLHNMLKHINFSLLLRKDDNLASTFAYLKDKGYQLSILTTEVFSTVETVSRVLGFDLKDFELAHNHHLLYSEKDKKSYPIICRNNCEDAKPSVTGFVNISKITGIPLEKMAYVGDSLSKDVKPPLSIGMKAVHVNKNAPEGRVSKKVTVPGLNECNESGEYLEISSVYQLKDIF